MTLLSNSLSGQCLALEIELISTFLINASKTYSRTPLQGLLLNTDTSLLEGRKRVGGLVTNSRTTILPVSLITKQISLFQAPR